MFSYRYGGIVSSRCCCYFAAASTATVVGRTVAVQIQMLDASRGAGHSVLLFSSIGAQDHPDRESERTV